MASSVIHSKLPVDPAATASRLSRFAPLGCAIVLLVAAGCGSMISPFSLRIGQLMFFFAGLALAWNLMGGLAGYRSFGHAAFVGMGGFAAGLAEARFPETAPLTRLAIGAGAAVAWCAFSAALLAFPVLRLRGSYFAIAMLGLSHVASELTTNIDALGGAAGLMFASIVPAGMDANVFFYELFIAGVALILFLSWRVRSSRFGHGLLSIREDEDTARMLGVPTERYKAYVFVLSAVLTGLLGMVYAHSLGFVTAASLYRDELSLNIVVFAMLGGTGALLGPIVGAVLLTLLVYVFLSDYPDVQLFVTGLVLVSLVLLAPEGLLGLLRRRLSKGSPS
jgi:branched-chain amino acid transport system permease protein